MGITWRGKQNFLGGAHFGGAVTGTMSPGMGSGKVFYVNGESYGPSASDSWQGTDPNYPLATLTQAISLCRQRTNDFIFVQGFYQTDTFPIVLNKRNIHIIGIAPGGAFQGRALFDGVGEPAFETGGSGGGTELAGLRMGASTGGDPCINVGANTYFMYIHDCSFGKYITATDGIYGGSGQYHMNGWTIEHCWFGSYLTDCGIECVNVVENHVVGNVFAKVAATGIKYNSGGVGEIIGNYFASPIGSALTHGWAITLAGAGCVEGLIMGNRAAQAGKVISTSNPYQDNSTEDQATMTNCWSDNMAGESQVKPTTE